MRGLIALLLFSLMVAAAMAAPAGTMPDLPIIAPADIAPMQHRLADGGCYTGNVDGIASRAFQIALRACPPQAPLLEIETRTHIAAAIDVAVGPGCRTVATASLDRTVRLWSMPEGRLMRTQRLPVGDGPEGLVYGVAISPDGSLIAAGGIDSHHDFNGKFSLYIFDTATGTNIRRIDFVGTIDHVAFSPDGKQLAVSQGYEGLRVLDVGSGRTLLSDRRYAQGETNLAYGPDGALYAIAFDGLLRRYAPNLRRTATAHLALQHASNISVSPIGGKVAVTFGDSSLIQLFDAIALRHLGDAQQPPSGEGGFNAIGWSSDGQKLFAAGTYLAPKTSAPNRMIVSYDPAGHYLASAHAASNTIYALKPCGDSMVFSGSDPVFGTLSGAGQINNLSISHVADTRSEIGSNYTLSADGKKLRFMLDVYARQPVLFDLTAGTLTDAPAAISGLMPPDVTSLAVTNWRFATPALLNGRPFVDVGETDPLRSDSLAIRQDRQGFVVGLTSFIVAADANGRMLWNQPGFGETYGTNLTPDGNIVVCASSDGTIRWFRWSDGKQLLSLFVEVPSKRWVAWTPTGYYMASPGGEDLIGWHVNRGWTQPADFFPVSRFRDRFNRPDIVRLVLDTQDEDAAAAKANSASRRKNDARPLIDELPPVIRISNPPDQTHVPSADVQINYAVRSPTGKAVDRIDVLIGGRPVKEIGLPLGSTSQAETAGTLKLSLATHDSTIGLIAWSGEAASAVANVKLVWDAAPASSTQDRKLYAVIVGISAYAASDMTLGFAAKDASDFAAALQDQKGGFYSDVQTRVLTDGAATRASIIEGLEWLESKATRPNDVGVLFLAGHGVTDAKQTYWFLPADATEDDIRVKGVSQDEMRRSLQALSGKVLWFLDTCHAGSAASRRPVDASILINSVTAAENGGIVAFASSTGREVSEENPAWKNGAFTKAILEGIDNGRADFFGEGTVNTSELDAYLERRVQQLTDGKQHPVMGRPPDEPDFTIAKTHRP